MKPSAILLTIAIVLPTAVFAAGGGGGGGGGGAGGAGSGHGGSTGAAAPTSSGTVGTGTATTGTAAGTPSAGTAGAGLNGVNGIPAGPANAAGLNNAGNNPSGSSLPSTPNTGTVGMGNPSVSVPRGPSPTGLGGTANEPAPGTNAAGTAEGSGGALRDNGRTMPGPNRPTATRDQERDSDAKIDEENRKTDRAVSNICKGC
jgi:hypothetical protein